MDEEERNYCSLALLLLRVGNPCLRVYFKTQWNAAGTYRPWTDCVQNGADLLLMFNPLPYEINTVKSGDTSQWDLSLFVKALLNSRPPFVIAANLVIALETLKEMRNELCHSPIPRVKASDFQKSWTDGCNALSLFGATTVDFDKVKQDVQKPWSELLAIMKHCADQDQDILDKLHSINSKLEQLQKGQDTIVEGQDRILQELSSQRKILESRAREDAAINVLCATIGHDASLTNGEIKRYHPSEKDLASRALEYTEKLKSCIKEQTDFLLTSEEEDKKIRTDDIFTNVSIERGKRKQFKELEEITFGRRQIYEIQASRTKLTTCSEMFVSPANDDQKSTASSTTNPKSILLTGKAGIGKSLFCRKLVRDWSHDRLFEGGQENDKVPDFQFVFLLTFRQLMLPEDERLDLRDILNRSSLLNEHSILNETLIQYIIENPEKLLILIDGYDEYKSREKITGDFETRYPNDPYGKIPVFALIAKIMKGKMLKGSVVLISSRPEKAEELSKIPFDVRCDIQGFSSPEVLEYIGKYFKENESMKIKVLHHIKANEILLSFSHIPVMCFLMCYCIKWYMAESKSTEKLPVTRTELYYEVIILFIQKHSSSKYEQMEESKVQEILHKLAELAVNLTTEGKYIFNEKDMKQFKFTDEEITNLKASGLLDCCPGVKKSPADKPPLEYTFTHLTLQEFLCAFSFVEKKQIPQREKTSDVIFTFIAGLYSRTKNEENMTKLIENIKPENSDDERNKLLTLSCLYEYKDDEFSTRVIQNLNVIKILRNGLLFFVGFTDMDCLYIGYLLDIVNLINEQQTKQHPTFTQSFIVKRCTILAASFSASGIRMLCNSLVSFPTFNKLVIVNSESLDDECVQIISDMLPRTNITEVKLSHCNITDVGVQYISSVLPDCRVRELNLLGNFKITSERVELFKREFPDVKLTI